MHDILAAERQRVNESAAERLEATLRECSGSAAWAAAVLRHHPFSDAASLLRAGEDAWSMLDDTQWEDALAANAEDTVPAGPEETRRAAAVALRLYRERFGIPFVSAAHSPFADELLMRVRIRLGNEPSLEHGSARDELRRAARYRLERLWHELS